MEKSFPKLTLYYFDIHGLAEMIRICLSQAKIPFEDIRMSKEEFLKLKAEGKFECKQVPVLFVDDIQIP